MTRQTTDRHGLANNTPKWAISFGGHGRRWDIKLLYHFRLPDRDITGHQIRSQGQLSRLRSALTLHAVLKPHSTCRFQLIWHKVMLAYSLVRTDIAALIGLLSRRTMIKFQTDLIPLYNLLGPSVPKVVAL